MGWVGVRDVIGPIRFQIMLTGRRGGGGGYLYQSSFLAVNLNKAIK